MRRVHQPRGTVILFAVFMILLMLAVAGLAVDVAGLVTTRTELYKATDAAALAGAGTLGFDSSVFPAARDAAVAFAGNNPSHWGSVTLDRNDGNAAGGDVVLGVWDGAAFTPSLDGSVVNAVQCRTNQTVPTAFLQLLGLTSMPMSAQSIAVSNPPNTPPSCVFPIGVTTCQFMNGPAWTSLGCGTAVTFATSSGAVPGTQAGTNTGAWVDLTGATPNAPYLKATLTAAANGTCTSNPVAGQPVGANNGMIQSVVDTFEPIFQQKYNASTPVEIKGPSGNVTYNGKGWEVYVPLIQTDCPPKAINGSYTIQTFSKFVFTQVINHGDCVVNNPADQNSYPLCPAPNGPGTKDPNLRAIFGYFDCAKLESTPTTIPTPRAALATRLRLVK